MQLLPQVMPEHHGRPANTGDVSGEVKSGLVTVTMSHGGTSDGMTFKPDQRATYHYRTIADINLCVCIVLFDGDTPYRFDPAAAGSDSLAAGVAANGASVYGPGVNPAVTAGVIKSPAVCTHGSSASISYGQPAVCTHVQEGDSPSISQRCPGSGFHGFGKFEGSVTCTAASTMRVRGTQRSSNGDSYNNHFMNLPPPLRDEKFNEGLSVAGVFKSITLTLSPERKRAWLTIDDDFEASELAKVMAIDFTYTTAEPGWCQKSDPFDIKHVASSTYTLGASSFEHPYAYLEYEETLGSSKNVDDYINEKMPAGSIYFPHAVALDNEQLKHDVWATNYLNAAFKTSYEDNDWVSSVDIGTRSGHSRSFPGGARKKDSTRLFARGTSAQWPTPARRSSARPTPTLAAPGPS